MGGTLTLWPGANLASQYIDFGQTEQMPAEQLVFCTLLGPEGPDVEEFARATRERTSGPQALNEPRSSDFVVTGYVQARGVPPVF
jgi:hypothetical protein